MKTDEIRLLLLIHRDHREHVLHARDIIAASGINPKRAHYILGKWSDKGLYEWGVNLDLGWLTDTGHALAMSLKKDNDNNLC